MKMYACSKQNDTQNIFGLTNDDAECVVWVN